MYICIKNPLHELPSRSRYSIEKDIDRKTRNLISGIKSRDKPAISLSKSEANEAQQRPIQTERNLPASSRLAIVIPDVLPSRLTPELQINYSDALTSKQSHVLYRGSKSDTAR